MPFKLKTIPSNYVKFNYFWSCTECQHTWRKAVIIRETDVPRSLTSNLCSRRLREGLRFRCRICSFTHSRFALGWRMFKSLKKKSIKWISVRIILTKTKMFKICKYFANTKNPTISFGFYFFNILLRKTRIQIKYQWLTSKYQFPFFEFMNDNSQTIVLPCS